MIAMYRLVPEYLKYSAFSLLAVSRERRRSWIIIHLLE